MHRQLPRSAFFPHTTFCTRSNAVTDDGKCVATWPSAKYKLTCYLTIYHEYFKMSPLHLSGISIYCFKVGPAPWRCTCPKSQWFWTFCSCKAWNFFKTSSRIICVEHKLSPLSTQSHKTYISQTICRQGRADKSISLHLPPNCIQSYGNEGGEGGWGVKMSWKLDTQISQEIRQMTHHILSDKAIFPQPGRL